MHIQLAESEMDLMRCFPLMVQLRPHLTAQEFAERVARQQTSGYSIAFVEAEGAIKAVAGFRVLEMLAYGPFLYVDDLVTDEAARSQGYGGALCNWLLARAKSEGCVELQLDSGVHRSRAHRFYFQKGMHISDFHFALKLM
jgi:GNAT superfamily N-acetyltransferase